MDFRRQDERRRRALIDDHGRSSNPTDEQDTVAATARNRASSRSPARKYHEAALTDRQPYVVDLIPHRSGTIALYLVGGVLLIAALQAAYWKALPRLHASNITGLTALDVAAPGSVASWVSTVVLALAAAVSGIVYSVRRHRNDDYAGRYRLWTWTSFLLMFLSLDAASGIHRVIPELMIRLTGSKLYGDGRAWWLAAFAVLATGMGIRFVRELRGSLAATLMLVATLLCYATAAVVELGLVPLADAVLAVVAQSTATLLGHFLLLVTVAIYARHELAVAQGRVKPAKSRKRKKRSSTAKSNAAEVESEDTEDVETAELDESADEDDSAAETESTTRIDKAHAAPVPHVRPAAQPVPVAAAKKPVLQIGSATAANASKTSDDDDGDEDDDGEDDDSSHLSRAERRRLKKLKRKEQRKGA